MRLLLLIAFGCCSVLQGASVRDVSVDRVQMFHFEKAFEQQVLRLWADDRYMFQQLPRAYYVPGYGLLLTSEFSLAPGPSVSPFHLSISKEEIGSHKHKVELRLPKLREFLQTEILSNADRFPALRDDEHLSIAITIYHFAWEDTADLPTQIVMQGVKHQLLEGKDKARAVQAIQVEERR